MWRVGSSAAEARAIAMLGDSERADEIALAADAMSRPIGTSAPVAIVAESLGISALCAGRYDEAYAYLRRMHDPADASYHFAFCLWNIAYFGEAAARSGQGADAAASLIGSPSPPGRARRKGSAWDSRMRGR